MSKKLKNIDALRKMVDGSHRTQTRKSISGYVSTKDLEESDFKSREIGETWYTYNPDGTVDRVITKRGNTSYYSRSELIYDREMRGESDEKLMFPNCQKSECTCKSPSRLDERFRVLRGMCFDCNLANETELQINGKFKDYAKDILLNNATAYFKDLDGQLEDAKRSIVNGVTYSEEDGNVEKWTPESGTAEELAEKIGIEYNQIKENTISAIKKI